MVIQTKWIFSPINWLVYDNLSYMYVFNTNTSYLHRINVFLNTRINGTLVLSSSSSSSSSFELRRSLCHVFLLKHDKKLAPFRFVKIHLRWFWASWAIEIFRPWRACSKIWPDLGFIAGERIPRWWKNTRKSKLALRKNASKQGTDTKIELRMTKKNQNACFLV